jgi:hypothetical protein
MKGKSATAASWPHHDTGKLPTNGAMQRMLTHHFEHPFKVSGVRGRRSISWTFGPHPDAVWAIILRRLPELAVEALAAAVANGAVEIEDAYFTCPIPQWLCRLDFFTAPAETFPGLLSMGGDPNESDPYGITPFDYAISRGNSERAVALIEAGAVFESYGPDGWQREALAGIPEVIAAMEATHLRQVTALAFGERCMSSRL